MLLIKVLVIKKACGPSSFNQHLFRQKFLGLTSRKSEANKFSKVLALNGDKYCFDLSFIMALF